MDNLKNKSKLSTGSPFFHHKDLNKYTVEYWYLHFIGDEDMGYDIGWEDVEAEDEETAIKIAKSKAPRGAKDFIIVKR